ncbi:DUF1015 domain-containing protein [Flavobacterium gawalongense]|uniref:DUF1015 domain-containing protein n=1 Tax=Flavobacterium gawalongense TaxID=2594432 RepID=A0A553BS91_9FLAO|nr:DUF1015 domain-containing protein [Flavobacterium gawalongense]TRX03240.1 DUF1015 domain-containing protein [Flavobacterium gawalongense]TRX09940.1 DUF1015 domain-containing protein [Flavobacterium gawalongense]TRX11099.1 DUF1015 domain-containing protein [Flavobacterium gawalongense]TRX12056.1 DUF1015 domain-containing protein [Flavobacterium gawalongense]TRX29902.1 DUF1015 domain-containing protein [Flavobacterium gawalongense]
MAKIVPFKAVRPTRDKVCLVTCRSYDEYSAAELAAQLDFNPLSFLHILKPAYTNQETVSFEKRYRQVHQKYQEFKNEIILVKDKKPAIYIHKIITKTHSFTGLIVGTSVEDYRNNIIKKHEDILAFRVKLLKDYMKYSEFNTEPVLMTYPDNKTIENWIFNCTQKLADFEFSTTEKEIHYLWKIEDSLEIDWLQNIFAKTESLYIADGHHRTEALKLLSEENENPENAAKDYILSYLISENNVKIYEFNRLIKDLNGYSKEDFIKELNKNFIIENKHQQPFKPAEKHQFGMYLDNEFYSLILRKENAFFNTALDSLDTQILYKKVLLPLLAIKDLRNDERIEYVSGKQSVLEVKHKIDQGEFEIGFILFPSNIGEIKALADAHLIMPPKSTYIEPKFRSGLVIYEL